jgi:hypothetical protein
LLEISFNSGDNVQGTLFMDRERVGTLTSLIPSSISVTRRTGPDRTQVEEFIEQVYARRFCSVIARHYPTLMNVHDQRGRVVAAVGVRLAADEPLLLERYLDQPVESALAGAMHAAVGRGSVVEIGNLASSSRGASVFLFVTLAAYLRQRQLTYAVVTGTKALRRSFALFGFDFVELGIADPGALPDRGASWGTYYTRDPKVLGGAIAPACARLEPYLPTEKNDDLERLFARFHPAAAGDGP